MPEGQAIHRLARIVSEYFEGETVGTSSPQGRFTAGAELLDSLVPGRAEAWGKHFFMPFSLPEEREHALGDDGPLWLHIHLGLYGKWSFTGPSVDAIRGAGIRKHSLTNHHAINTDGPGKTVRLRITNERLTADLTGPHRCEVLDGAGVRAIIAKLGPDPIRNEPGDREHFIEQVRKRRTPVGQLVMDQSVTAGPGNIYRADCLWRVGISPLRAGNKVSQARLCELWDDLVATMQADVPSGVIKTIPAEYQPSPIPEDDPELARFAVYHRTGRPCLRCGTAIAEKELASRRLFWCPGCQH